MRKQLLRTGAATLALALMAGGAAADQASDVEAVKTADSAFYAALSAMDAKTMAALWADKPYVTNIGPSSKSVAVGSADAVTHWMAVVVPGRYSEVKTQMATIASVQVEGNVAWVVGEEKLNGKNTAGEPVSFALLVTDIFEKDGGRWLMISHHAQIPPK